MSGERVFRSDRGVATKTGRKPIVAQSTKSDKMTDMEINARGFVRQFRAMRRRADAGEIIHVRARDGSYSFRTESSGKHGLLGCCADTTPRKGSKPGPVERPSAWEFDR